jgi:thiol-disulfide isomerase/thioredoxin
VTVGHPPAAGTCQNARMRRAALCLALAVVSAPPARADDEIGEGLPAPSFSLRTLNPEACGAGWIALDRFVGEEAEDAGAKAVVISFFASWCEPCKREMPFLVQLDRMYREHGLRVLSVDIDREEPGIAAAKRMVAAAKATHPVLSDRFNFLARRYLGDQAPLPSVFIVRRDGIVAKIERGYAKDASAFLLAEVQEALGMEPVRNRPPARAATAAAVQRANVAPAAATGDATPLEAPAADDGRARSGATAGKAAAQ